MANGCFRDLNALNHGNSAKDAKRVLLSITAGIAAMIPSLNAMKKQAFQQPWRYQND